MSDLSPRERGLLVALRGEDEPSREDRARVRAAVAARIALAGGAVGVGAAAVAKTASAATGAGAGAGAGAGSFGALFSWKVGVAVVALTAASAGGAAWKSGAMEAVPAQVPPPITHVAERALAVANAATTAAEAPAEAPAAPAPGDAAEASAAVDRPPAPAHARAASSPQSGAADDSARAEKEMQEELALMTEAQRALKDGDSKGALSALDRHAAEHPKGTLAIERAGVRAIALCESGKVPEGKAAAKRFLAQNPKSVLAARIRAACL